MVNNRKRMFAVSLVVPVLALVVVALARPRDSWARRFPHIEFGETATMGEATFVQHMAFPKMPSEVRVYKVQPLPSKRDALVKILKALPSSSSSETDKVLRKIGRKSASSLQNEEPLSASIGDWSVDVYSGGQSYIQHYVAKTPEKFEDIPPAPAPKEAQKAADELLAKLPLPADLHCVKVCPGRVISRGLGPNDQVVKEMAVLYDAVIDGIPLYGAVDVSVGAGPTILCLNSRLRNIVPDEKVAILSPQEAYDRLSAGKCHWNQEPYYGKCNVASVKLVYYLGATATTLPYIMPIYVFGGESVASGKKPNTWKAFVEAVRPEFLEAKPYRR